MRRSRKAPVEGAAEPPVTSGAAESPSLDGALEAVVVDPGTDSTEDGGRTGVVYRSPRRRGRRPRSKKDAVAENGALNEDAAASAEGDAAADAPVEAIAAPPPERAPAPPVETSSLADIGVDLEIARLGEAVGWTKAPRGGARDPAVPPLDEAARLIAAPLPEMTELAASPPDEGIVLPPASLGQEPGLVAIPLEEPPKPRRPRRPRGGRGRRRGDGEAPPADTVATDTTAEASTESVTDLAAVHPAQPVAEWAPVDQPPPPLEAPPLIEAVDEIILEPIPFEPATAAAVEGEATAAHLEFPREDEVAPAPEDAPPPEEPLVVYMRPRRERGRRRRGDRDRPERPADEPAAAAPAPAAAAPEAPPRPERERERPRERDRDREPDRERERPAAAERAERPERGERAERAERLVKEIIVNVDPRETRIAVIENGRLVELHVEREERVVGSIYKGKVANVLPGMDAAFVEIGLERNAFLYVGDILYESGEENGIVQHRRAGRELKIRDVAKTGQEILVQVVKGPRGTKGARVSTRMSLPGRYIVLMPESDNLGVSRKIEDADERERLKKIGEQVRPHGFGMIIRTEAEGRTDADLRQDLDLLVKQWRTIQEKAKRTPPAGLVHQDLSLLLKTIRDVFSSDVDRLLLDSPSDFHKVQELLEVLSPKLASRVELYEGPEPIFHKFGLDQEIERLLRRKVWLRSGGYISIDSTEALTAIDVNTGKFIGTTSLSDTILKTNLDAVVEITRQFRLRDIGGMIIIDFIDMSSARDRAQVMAALEKALKKDRTRTKVAHISPLGLVEMTRKRTGETVTDLLTDSCPYCQGRGRVSSPESISIHIAREIKRRCAQNEVDAILVHTNPEVAAYLIGPEGDNVEALEKEIRRPIYVRARHDFHIEKFEVLPGDMMEIEEQLMPYRGGQVVECQVQKMELIAAPRSAAWADGYFVDLANGTRYQGQTARVRLTDVRRSFALGEPLPPASALDKSEPI